MKLYCLPAIRWLKDARKTLPSPRYPAQPMRERCKEVLSDQAQWYADLISKATKREE